MSPTNYARALTKVSIGQILQTVGFQSAQSTALDLLVEVLERYVIMISRSTHDYAELANRTEPTLDDLACAFERHRVVLNELEEYISWVDTPEYRLNKHSEESSSIVARSKKPIRDYLGCCEDEKSRKELKDRESDEEWEHVYDYMPLMTRPQSTTNIDELNKTAAAAAALNESNINDISIISNNLADLSTTNAPATVNGFKEEPASSVIEKNGIKYSNYTWKSMYEPKHTSSRGSVIINRRMSQIGATIDDLNRSISNREPCSATAKLPVNFQRPKSKYKKSIYNNAVSIYNKSISSTSGVQPLEEIIDEEKLLKQSMSQPMLETGETTAQIAVESTETNVIIPSAIETTPIVTAETNEAATSTSTQQKSKVDEMIESYLTKYSSTTTAAPSSSSSAAAASGTQPSGTGPPAPIKLKLVQSTSAIDSESRKEQPTVPKLKISGLFGAASTAAEAKSKNTPATAAPPPVVDFSIEEFSTTTINGNQESRLASNDHFDDNAMDGDDMIKTSKSNEEHLIWKPITTKINAVKSPTFEAASSLAQSPPASATGRQPASTSIKPTLVDYSSNSMESSNVDSVLTVSNQPPGTEAATTQELNEQQLQAKATGTEVAAGSSSSKHKKKKKNKDKDKDKDKDKEKDKGESKEGGEKSKEKKEKDKKDKHHHHHHHHHKKKDKEKHKSSESAPLSPTSSKKKEKKLKKLLKKEQKKLSKNIAASTSESASLAATGVEAAASDNNTNSQQSNNLGDDEPSVVNQNTLEEPTSIPTVSKTPQISIKISKSSLEPPRDEETITRNDVRLPNEENKNVDTTIKPTPNQPPLPKLKLKISSSSSTSSSNDPTKSTTNKPTVSIESPNVVKPLKINLGKAPPSTTNRPKTPSNEETATSTTTRMVSASGKESESNNDEDEIELGEVVKPKPAKMMIPSMVDKSHQQKSAHSSHQAANAFVNNPPSTSSSSAAAANISGFTSNQQQLQQKSKLAMKPLVKPNQGAPNNSNNSNNNSTPLRREQSIINQPSNNNNNTNAPKPNKPRQSPQQQQQRQSPTDLDAATALLLNTQVDLQITPDLATNLANLAAADPTNASSILTSLPLLLALQAHNQAALNRLNSLTGANGNGSGGGGGGGVASSDDVFLPSPIAPSQKKPVPTINPNRPPNKTPNANMAPTNSGPSHVQKQSPGDTPNNQMINIKKRKQFDSMSGEIPNRINTESSGAGSYHSTPTSSGLVKNANNAANSSSSNNGNSLNRPKIKQMRKEFTEGLPNPFLPMESLARSSKESMETSGVLLGGSEGNILEESINFESYESSKEYLWHQQRIKQEELQLQEQLEQLKASRGNNAPPPKMPPANNNNQKRVSLPESNVPPSSSSTNKYISTSTSKLPVNVPPLNLNKPQKKQQLSDMETIFTPVITPVVKSRISPLSHQQQQQQHHHQEAIIDIMNVDNNNTRAGMLMSQKSGGGGATTSNKSRPKSSSISPNMTATTSSIEASNFSFGSGEKVSSKAGGGGGTTMTIIGTAVECTDVVSNQLWICPTCNKPDDSVPMIGCDSCDDWYHWHCIGITKEPPKNQNWYCHKCGSKTKSGGGASAAETIPGDAPTSSKADDSATRKLEKEKTNDSLNITATTTTSSPNDSGSYRSPTNDSFSSLIGGNSFLNSGFNSAAGLDYLSSLKKKKKKP